MTKATLARTWADMTGRSHEEATARLRVLSEAGELPNRAIGPKLQPLTAADMATALMGLLIPRRTNQTVQTVREWEGFICRDGEFRTVEKMPLKVALSCIWELEMKIFLVRLRVSQTFRYAQLLLSRGDTWNPETGMIDPYEPTEELIFGPEDFKLSGRQFDGIEDIRVVHFPLIRRLADVEQPLHPLTRWAPLAPAA